MFMLLGFCNSAGLSVCVMFYRLGHNQKSLMIAAQFTKAEEIHDHKTTITDSQEVGKWAISSGLYHADIMPIPSL